MQKIRKIVGAVSEKNWLLTIKAPPTGDNGKLRQNTSNYDILRQITEIYDIFCRRFQKLRQFTTFYDNLPRRYLSLSISVYVANVNSIALVQP